MRMVTKHVAVRPAPAWLRAWPYRPALTHPVMRRLLPGYAVSALGDGMSVVAIAWLALRLAPPGRQGLWVGAAVAAYSLPGVLGMVALRPWLCGRGSARLAGADATLRALALGATGLLAAAHLLGPLTYVCLLGVSSLLHAWGTAGQYTLIAEILPPRHRVAGNGLLAITAQIAMIGGPALAGVLTGVAGPAVVIAADAATWAVLAVSYARTARLALDGGVREPSAPVLEPTSARKVSTHVPPGIGGWHVIRGSGTLAGMLGLTVVFYALYGPVEVALPVYIGQAHQSAAVLGGFWTANAAGAVLGSLAAPYLRRRPVWPAMIAIVAGWGLFLLPVGLGAPLAVSLLSCVAGGVIYAPYNSLTTAVFQDASPAGALGQVLAIRSAWIILSVPLGSACGGPAVAALGARGTLLASALATMALALVAAVTVGATARARHGPGGGARPPRAGRRRPRPRAA
jgi:DHA3 family macrolide efflux protein-like MFS transporter